eukprot:12420154-Karenia_brevis.AAC.1
MVHQLTCSSRALVEVLLGSWPNLFSIVLGCPSQIESTWRHAQHFIRGHLAHPQKHAPREPRLAEKQVQVLSREARVCAEVRLKSLCDKCLCSKADLLPQQPKVKLLQVFDCDTETCCEHETL